MRALIRAYKKSTSIEKNAVYLFMVPYTCTDSRLQGFMPFNRQFGFVFTRANGSNAAADEPAHETFNQ